MVVFLFIRLLSSDFKVKIIILDFLFLGFGNKRWLVCSVGSNFIDIISDFLEIFENYDEVCGEVDIYY